MKDIIRIYSLMYNSSFFVDYFCSEWREEFNLFKDGKADEISEEKCKKILDIFDRRAW